MLTWILIILYSSLCASDPTYECGPHGKFEYCIDGIPGCVIGCHCHPGYYFDTDTKICEPNIKLSQDYRRHYMPFEPTRVQNLQDITLPPITTEATKDAIDEKLDEITNDADDLGDWLYNQFFKTIENQVINKTNDDKQMLTRRSGVQMKKPVRRSHKHMRSKKPKKPKKKNLRSKLLRITEDDSLFHSSSESDDDSSASSDTDTDDSDDGSESGRGKRKKDKDRGGHRKILIYNKKPRPPLPSFIFLPNMDTPFFPPIGLPPPPIPMYPMIPVPPVLGPMYPCPPPPGPPVTVMPDPINVTKGTTTTSTQAPEDEKSPPETEDTPPQKDDKVQADVEDEKDQTDDQTDDQTKDQPKDQTKDQAQDNVERSRPRYRAGARSRTRGRSQKNLKPMNKLLALQKLRQKMMRQKKIDNYLAEHQMEPDLTAMEENLPTNEIPSSNPMKINLEQPQSVDFKYLTELIHKIDPNGAARGNLVNALAQNPVPVPVGTGAGAGALSKQNNNNNLGHATNQPANQLQNLVINNNTRRHNMDDSYYSGLGKQIASMIKNIDMTDNHHIDVEIEPHQETPMLHPIFNENSYGTRSYWERQVRSPIKYVGAHNEHMSEEHLFDLENEVETAASTVRTLNLHELETIIFNMNQPKKTQQKANTLPTHLKNIVLEPARVMFNLDTIVPKSNITNLIKTADTKVTTELTKVTTELQENSLQSSTLKSILYPDVFIGSNMRDFNHFTTLESQVIFNNPYFFQPTRKPNEMPVFESKIKQPIHNIDQSRYNLDQSRYNENQLRYNPNQLNYNAEQSKYNNNLEQLKYNMEQARYQNNQVPFNFPIPAPSSKFPGHNPFVNSYANNSNMTKIRYDIKPPSYNLSPNIYYYSTNNKNNYVFEKPGLPIKILSFTRKANPFIKRIEPHSYFQNQFQHQFDNEDDF